MGIKVFLLKPEDKIRVWLRRYVSQSQCPTNSYHDGMTLVGDFDFPYSRYDSRDYRAQLEFEKFIRPPDDDTRWPTQCSCGYVFQEEDVRQLFAWQTYSGSPDGQLTTLHRPPAGALYYATWYKSDDGKWFGDWDNMDGPPLICVLPNGRQWNIDSRASNCTLQEERTHRCWVRHGDPPNIHVDKNGYTCHAGAGSIQAGDWHGFLHNGELV